MQNVDDIAANIRTYRQMRGMTLPELAAKAGVSKAFVWEIENGNSKRPGAETLFKIAEALDVTIAHLMGKQPTAGGEALIEPEINEGLWDFISERKRQGKPLDPEEVKSLSFVQLRGGRPHTKEQWALIYGMLNEMTGGVGK